MKRIACQDISKMDHSILSCNFDLEPWITPIEINDQHDNDTRIKYKLDQIPDDFLGDKWADNIQSCIQRIDNTLSVEKDISRGYEELVELVKHEANKEVPKIVLQPGKKMNSKKMKALAYWNKDLQHKWNDTCKQEKSWRRCRDNRQTQILKGEFNRKRKEFDRCLRKTRRKHQLDKQERLMETCDNDPMMFWKELDKIGIAGDRKQRIPMEVEVEGEVISSISDVLDKWKSDFKSIYANVSNGRYDEQHLVLIRQRLQEMEQEYTELAPGHVNENMPDVSNLNQPISLKEVQDAIYRAKKRKALGIDELPAELLQNEVTVGILFKIFTHCFSNSVIPQPWKRGIIHPIFKPSNNNTRNPLHYRGITLMCATYKMYCSILNKRLNKWLEDHDVIADEQNGFRALRSCIDHVYALYALIQNRMLKKQDTLCCYIDVSKAFDSVDRDCLKYKLMKVGINGRMYHAINSLYDGYQCSVRINDKCTDFFEIPNGLKQGCIMSATLFKIYINDLVKDINNLNLGCTFEDNNLSMLMFADDIVLVSPSEDHLQQMLNCVANWCKKWRLSLNSGKTQIVHYRHHSKPRSLYQFKCGEMQLEYNDKYKYLGVWIQEHLDLSVMVKESAKSATRALGKLISRFKASGGSAHNVYTRLFETGVLPIIRYSAGLWGIKEYGHMNTVLNKAGRFLLGLPPRAPNIATQGEMGWNSIIYHTRLEAIRIYCRLNTMDEERITYKIFNWSKSVGNQCKNWVFFMNKFLRENDLLAIEVNKMDSKAGAKYCMEALQLLEKEKWCNKLWNDGHNVNGNKLRTYRRFKGTLEKEKYLDINVPRDQRSAFVKLRCGVLPLEVETGRYNGTILEERVCKLCNNGDIEDEVHFLITCPIYQDIRRTIFEKAVELDETFNNWERDRQAFFILSNTELSGCAIKVVNRMYLKRKSVLSK